jgi:tRNA(adenine34) deaminase
MRLALDEARKAAEEGEVPVGAVLVHEGNVISSARNLCEQRHDPTAHSESLLLREGLMGSWHFEEATLYVTKEPCVMCAGAMINARLGHLVYGCSDTKGGGLTIYGLLTDGKLNHTVEVTSGILEEDSINLLQSFFKARRGASKSGSSK